MADGPRAFVWRYTNGYEAYVGRWSRLLAVEFLAWFVVPTAGRWLDVGCGTGALTKAVLDVAGPLAVLGIDSSPVFVDDATTNVVDPRVRFAVGDAHALPAANSSYDAVVAGLVLNFLSDPSVAVAGMARASRPGGAVGAYVWDYSGGMQRARYFWEAVAATDAAAAALDPSPLFPLCSPGPLAELFRAGGLGDVVVEAIDLPMAFRDFDEYWRPYLLEGASPAQRYATSLGEDQRTALREQLRATLPIAADGSLHLIDRAWAVRGTK